MLVDKSSQRAILVGEGGARMKAIASQARGDMEALFGGRVFLDVWVRVEERLVGQRRDADQAGLLVREHAKRVAA